jgi:outer membrane protein TolC
VALNTAQAADAEARVVHLDVLLEAQRLFHELSFLHEHRAVLEAERLALERFEEAARARYATGRGTQQEVVRIQAQITLVDQRALDLDQRQASLTAAFNSLRDRPGSAPVIGLELSPPRFSGLEDMDQERLLGLAHSHRPALAAAHARVAQRRSLTLLAEKGYKPDFTLGAAYTLVGKRTDPLGQDLPPPDNGEDILGISASLNLPVWRKRLDAGLQEAQSRERVAEEETRHLLTEIDGQIAELAARLPLLYDQWSLLENVLRVQAEEALRSAESAYVTGGLNAVDLLDAEVMLYDARTAAARASADYAIALARLERAVAVSLTTLLEPEDHEE